MTVTSIIVSITPLLDYSFFFNLWAARPSTYLFLCLSVHPRATNQEPLNALPFSW